VSDDAGGVPASGRLYSNPANGDAKAVKGLQVHGDASRINPGWGD